MLNRLDHQGSKEKKSIPPRPPSWHFVSSKSPKIRSQTAVSRQSNDVIIERSYANQSFAGVMNKVLSPSSSGTRFKSAKDDPSVESYEYWRERARKIQKMRHPRKPTEQELRELNSPDKFGKTYSLQEIKKDHDKRI
jgi:hypothetical protein